MKIGIIGLGKMGFNLAQNLMDSGHSVVAFNRTLSKVDEIKKHGVISSYSLQEFVNKLGKKKVIWLMVTAGNAVDVILKQLVPLLEEGDVVIDGGNSFYKDSIRRAKSLNPKGIVFMDIGTSGGITGARNGACLMIGGDKKTFERLEGVFKGISVQNGYGYFGKSGSGHFVKMVHNGIEYGMMQAIGEGLEVIDRSDFEVDKEKLAKVWNNGSVIRSWLVELIQNAYSKDKELKKYSGVVGLSGEGEWTVQTAKEIGVQVPVIEASVNMRLRSNELKLYQGKVVQALRYEFGQHEEPSYEKQ